MSGVEIGTVAGWVTAFSTTGIFAGVAVLVRAWWRRGIDLRTLNNADRADIRDHYASEVTALREKLGSQETSFRNIEKHWREMLEASDRRHQECEDSRERQRVENMNLHRELGEVKLELSGLTLQLKRYSADSLVLLDDLRPVSERAPESRKAADRVRKIIDGRESGK